MRGSTEALVDRCLEITAGKPFKGVKEVKLAIRRLTVNKRTRDASIDTDLSKGSGNLMVFESLNRKCKRCVAYIVVILLDATGYISRISGKLHRPTGLGESASLRAATRRVTLKELSRSTY